MLKSLKIRNFESHRNSLLRFGPGVNAIIGESDQGKSAILRALEWVLFNRPLGEEVMSNWLDDINTFVQAEFTDGTLKRKRTKAFNGYILNNDIENPFKGFKNKVPDVIRDFVNMSEINILSQDDPLFMISWKPGERGRYLNEICDMQIIDTATSNINKQIRHERSELKVLEAGLEDDEKKLDQFEDLDRLEKQVSELEDKADEIERLQAECESLTDIIDNLQGVAVRRRKYNNVLKYSGKIDALLKKQKEIESLKVFCERLDYFIDEILEKQYQLKEAKADRDSFQQRFDELMPETCPLCGK